MKKIYKTVIISLMLALLVTTSACSLTENKTTAVDQNPLHVRVSKDLGYSGLSSDIQGTFSIHVSGPENLVEVHFYLDETLLGSDKQAKFALQFNTENYESGWHEIYAIGFLADGTELRSNTVRREFVAAEGVMDFVLIVVGLLLVFSMIGALVPMLMGRQGGAVSIGNYGAAGAAVCKRCGFPFKRSMFAPNLAIGKLSRCPHCGKVAISRRALATELTAAEERYLAAQDESCTIETPSAEDALRRSLEESKFDD